METLIWEGQEDFKTFVHIVKTIGYKYVILCFSEIKEEKKQLGAACLNHVELVDMLIKFSDMGYSCKIEKIDVVENLN